MIRDGIQEGFSSRGRVAPRGEGRTPLGPHKDPKPSTSLRLPPDVHLPSLPSSTSLPSPHSFTYLSPLLRSAAPNHTASWKAIRTRDAGDEPEAGLHGRMEGRRTESANIRTRVAERREPGAPMDGDRGDEQAGQGSTRG